MSVEMMRTMAMMPEPSYAEMLREVTAQRDALLAAAKSVM